VSRLTNGYLVTFTYGRRGYTLKTGAKTPQPVSRTQAVAIYDKLVAAKQAKGYHISYRPGTPYQRSPRDERDTGIHCQLLNPIEESEVSHLLTLLFHTATTTLQEAFRTRLGLPDGRIGAIAGVHTSHEKITWNPTTTTVIYRSKRHHNTKRNFEIFKAPDFIAAALLHLPPKGQQTVRYYPGNHGTHRATVPGGQGMDPR